LYRKIAFQLFLHFTLIESPKNLPNNTFLHFFYSFSSFFFAKSLECDFLTLYLCRFSLRKFLSYIQLINYFSTVMNKAELINAVAEKSGLSKVDSKKAIDAVVASITEALKQGDKVALVGFGTFMVAERGERTGVNPATKQTITIAAKKVAKFKPGAELAEAVL